MNTKWDDKNKVKHIKILCFCSPQQLSYFFLYYHSNVHLKVMTFVLEKLQILNIIGNAIGLSKNGDKYILLVLPNKKF